MHCNLMTGHPERQHWFMLTQLDQDIDLLLATMALSSNSIRPWRDLSPLFKLLMPKFCMPFPETARDPDDEATASSSGVCLQARKARWPGLLRVQSCSTAASVLFLKSMSTAADPLHSWASRRFGLSSRLRSWSACPLRPLHLPELTLDIPQDPHIIARDEIDSDALAPKAS